MGKSNRIRTKRAEQAVKAPQVTKEKKGAPSWLYPVIAAVVMVAVVFGVAASLISSSGIIFRNQKAIKSENYSMSGTMIQYMFMEQYSSFVSNNQNYLSLYGLDTAHDLKEQKYTLDDSIEGGYDTWYDYFMAATIDQANEILIYCEEADKRGIKLEEADLASVDSQIAQIEMMVSIYNSMGYNYTVDSYIASMYGPGIKEKDIRNYVKLYTLATKCAATVGEELENAITADRINAEYDANKNLYNVVDYDVFSTTVSYSALQKELFPDAKELTDAQKTTLDTEYAARILQANLDKEEFSVITDPAEFETKLLTNTIERNFNKLYNAEALADADKISDDVLPVIKATMTANLIAEVYSGASAAADDTTTTDGKFFVYNNEVTENAAKAIDNVKNSLFSTLVSLKNSSFVEKATYSETNEAIKWAFGETAAGSVRIDETGDAPKDGTVTKDKGTYSVSVYILKTPAHRDEMISKNVSFMTFTTLDAAAKAIGLIDALETVNAETFAALATSASAAETSKLESYLEGDSSYTELDKWLFDPETKVGDYTKTPLLLSSTEDSKLFGVFFYESDSDAAWYLDVKAAIYGEDADAKYAELLETYPVTVNEKVTNKVSN